MNIAEIIEKGNEKGYTFLYGDSNDDVFIGDAGLVIERGYDDEYYGCRTLDRTGEEVCIFSEKRIDTAKVECLPNGRIKVTSEDGNRTIYLRVTVSRTITDGEEMKKIITEFEKK